MGLRDQGVGNDSKGTHDRYKSFDRKYNDNISQSKGYVPSAKNLNSVATQLDVDIYDDQDVKVQVTGMKKPIELALTRNEWKLSKLSRAISVPGASGWSLIKNISLYFFPY